MVMLKARKNRKARILPVTILLPLCLSISSCLSRERSQLDEVERLLETNPAQADTLISKIQEPAGFRNRALYAILKTQTDYKNYRPITDIVMIITLKVEIFMLVEILSHLRWKVMLLLVREEMLCLRQMKKCLLKMVSSLVWILLLRLNRKILIKNPKSNVYIIGTCHNDVDFFCL